MLLSITDSLESSGEFNACLAFGLTGILVFTVSASYHFLHDGFQISKPLAAKFENLDHSSIYLFIVGTYTPVILNTLSQKDSVLGVILVWTIALLGIAYTYAKPFLPIWMQHRYLSTAIVYATGRPKFKNSVFGSHELWHAMVLLGFVSHFAMILDFYHPVKF